MGGWLGGNRDRRGFLLLFLLRRRLLREVVLLLEVLDPGVIEYLDEGQSLCGLVNQDLIDKILVLVGEARLEPDLPSHDLVADLPGVHSSERGSPVDKLVKQDTKGPDVECVVVIFVLDHLRCHVLKRAAEGVSLLHVVGLDAPAEITDFDDVPLLDEDVLGLNVSMNQALLVQVVDA